MCCALTSRLLAHAGNAPLPAGVAARWRPNATALLPVALPPAVPGVRTWRHDLYPTYKAARAPPPPLLLESIPLVQELLDALALPWVSVAGVEADDVVATLAAAGGAHALRTAVVSPDKDFQQASGSACVNACRCAV
jgi:hypothetical protein